MTARSPALLALACATVLGVAAPAAAVLPTVEFDTPAQANGRMALEGSAWALLVFHPSAVAWSEADLQADATTNHSRAQINFHRPGTLRAWLPSPTTSLPESIQGEYAAGLSFRGSWSSLYIEADSLKVQATGTEGLLTPADGEGNYLRYLPREAPDGTYLDAKPPSGVVWGLTASDGSAGFPASWQVEGVRRVQWHNATMECRAGPCLDGARDQGPQTPIPGGWAAGRIQSVREVTGSSGRVAGNGTPWAILVGGAALSTEVDGWMRLPNARLDGPCGGALCTDPGGRTLQVQGQFTLHGLAPVAGSDRRVASPFSTGDAAARIDESPTFSLQAGSAWALAAASGAGIVAFLWKPLLGLFARNPARSVLDHPKAKLLHGVILQNPGLSFEGLRRATGLGYGTVQYHLKRLLDRGHVAAYSYGKRVRYFEDHGRHAQDWKVHAALHKPELSRLHQWLTGHPGVSQAYILRQTADWGWGRSTTQKFLKQLEGAGLVDRARSTMSVEYTALRLAPA